MDIDKLHRIFQFASTQGSNPHLLPTYFASSLPLWVFGISYIFNRHCRPTKQLKHRVNLPEMTDPEIIEILDSDDETTENNDDSYTNENQNVESQYSPIRINLNLKRRKKRERDETPFKNPFDSTDEENDETDKADKNNVDSDDDEVMIIDPPPKKEISPIHVSKDIPSPQTKKARKLKSKKTKNNEDENEDENDEDIEIEYCGITNVQEFPHMRQHCTRYPFWVKVQKGRKQNNKRYCDKCYCFVCDVPVKDCSDWNVHCSATDSGKQKSKWQTLRKDLRKEKQLL